MHPSIIHNMIAPIKIGSNSIIGAGSAITKNVGANKLSLTRSSQKVLKKRKSNILKNPIIMCIIRLQKISSILVFIIIPA